ncbi:MAG: hypothetical protein R3E66_21700 [bacterium]
MSAHPVAHDEELQTLVDEEVVLVVISNATHIRGRPELKFHEHTVFSR